ncbi:MAG: orotidine-5'-phosphate decarboxylase [Phycisphaerales bacterium]
MTLGVHALPEPTRESGPAAAADRLAGAIERADTPACVGLDPVHEKLPEAMRSMRMAPASAILAFCLDVIESVAGVVGVVKPQAACFERYGAEGASVLGEVIARAKQRRLFVILDAKRSDIASSAEHYAAGALALGADAITLSPYMGRSAITPFLDAGLGVFVLARTSNPDSDEVQAARLEGGASVAEHVASMIADLGRAHVGARGLSGVGAVVGATKASSDGARMRALMPDQVLLVPGVGAQGGSVEDVRPMARPEASSPAELGLVVNASRSVLYATPEGRETWQEAVSRAATGLVDDLRALAP